VAEQRFEPRRRIADFQATPLQLLQLALFNAGKTVETP
jgi:hypothetical protein